MASTNTTTNYGLPLYADGDIPNWKDTNTAYSAIDTALKQVVEGLAAIQTNLSNLVDVNGSGLTVQQYSTLGVHGNE